MPGCSFCGCGEIGSTLSTRNRVVIFTVGVRGPSPAFFISRIGGRGKLWML